MVAHMETQLQVRLAIGDLMFPQQCTICMETLADQTEIIITLILYAAHMEHP